MKIQNCLQVKVFVWEEALRSTRTTTLFGDLSAILIENMPIWAEFSSTPSNRISLMSDWEKNCAIINDTQNQFCRCPFLDVLMNKRKQEKETYLKFAKSEVYFHGGVNFEPYREQSKKYPRKDFKYYEIYNASEGFFCHSGPQ
jgi:hypothetical protein